MRFEITHTTTYAYDRPVFCEPHTLRLRPRCDAWQRLERHEVLIEPPPAGRSEGIDENGNPCTWVWFEGMHTKLELRAVTAVETLRADPFDYVIPSEEAKRLPVPYAEAARAALGACLQPSDHDDRVRSLADDMCRSSGDDVLSFLSALATRLYEDVEMIVRDEGEPLRPAETLGTGVGSCRDLAVLFCDVCRHAGIASRFVSGYQEGDPDQRERHLHAWSEVYVPGGGWRGYDPTHGLAVADRHVALAAAPTSSGAAPTSGRFRGTGARGEMSVDLSIVVTGSPA
jgi:transglutaminase-like putative cysteine protease